MSEEALLVTLLCGVTLLMLALGCAWADLNSSLRDYERSDRLVGRSAIDLRRDRHPR